MEAKKVSRKDPFRGIFKGLCILRTCNNRMRIQMHEKTLLYSTK